MKRKCAHRVLIVRTEDDGCYWIACPCGKRGPHKHSVTLALIAWALKLTDQHPRKK